EGGFGAAALLTLSAISAISSTGDTGASTRTSSPARSSAATKACTLGNMEGKGMPSEQQTNGFPPPAPKKAEHYAEKRDWPGYFEVVLGKPARETLVDALARFERDGAAPGFAIDLGCGEGRDSAELLRRGWRVLAIDGHESA